MKPFMFIMAPVMTRSGYGDHSRDLITSLIKMDMFDIKIKSLPWGNTPMTGLDWDNNEEHNEIFKRIYMEQGLNVQPDIMIHIGVPNEFQTWGKFNIGITAGIETTQCSPDWMQGVNKMDLVIVPSEHSKNVFEKTVFTKKEEGSDDYLGELKCETPIHVLFEGVDTDVYKQTKEIEPRVDEEMSKVEEKDCFLYVGHWLKGNLGEDRKDVSGLVKVFCETFKNMKKPPALVLKTSGADFSHIDRREIAGKIREVRATVDVGPGGNQPPVYFIHGDLSDDEMNSLYNHPKVISHVTFTKGEGYGRPLAEASCSGKLVMAPKWSGHVDFLNPKYTILFGGQLKEVDDSAIWEGVIDKGSQWFQTDYALASTMMKNFYKNQKSYKVRGYKQAKHISEKFSLDKMTEKFKEIMDNELPTHAKEVEIKLPDLPGMELPTLRSS